MCGVGNKGGSTDTPDTLTQNSTNIINISLCLPHQFRERFTSFGLNKKMHKLNSPSTVNSNRTSKHAQVKKIGKTSKCTYAHVETQPKIKPKPHGECIREVARDGRCRREEQAGTQDESKEARRQSSAEGHHMWRPSTIDCSQIMHYLLKQNIAYLYTVYSALLSDISHKHRGPT